MKTIFHAVPAMRCHCPAKHFHKAHCPAKRYYQDPTTKTTTSFSEDWRDEALAGARGQRKQGAGRPTGCPVLGGFLEDG
jgi:hypothetical protein